MKIGHCQYECTPGNYQANIDKMIKGLEIAEKENVDILSFPESFLTGYYTDGKKAFEHAFSLDDALVKDFLKRMENFSPTFMFGLNELRGEDIYNTIAVVEKGKIIGRYSKAFPCFPYFQPGREFPVFEKNGWKFGIIICADSCYTEVSRILMLNGADIIFAPHYNYIGIEGTIAHFMRVRANHIARAVENGVWFLRGNNVCSGYDEGMAMEGLGYGDSYLIDPYGEIIVRSQRHAESFICYTLWENYLKLEPARSVMCLKELKDILVKAIDETSVEPLKKEMGTGIGKTEIK